MITHRVDFPWGSRVVECAAVWGGGCVHCDAADEVAEDRRREWRESDAAAEYRYEEW